MKVVLGIIAFFVTFIAIMYHRDMVKEPSIDMEEESKNWLNRLYNGRQSTCLEQLRITKEGFRKLCRLLHDKCGLMATRNVTIEEVVAMFLHILAHNLKNSTIKCCFRRSGETVSRQFQSVLRAVLKLHKDFIRLHEPSLEEHDVEKWKWFKGEGNSKGKKKNITWNADMDNALVDVLFDQMALGNKADPDKANGEGAETAADVDEVLPNEEGGDVEFVSASLGLEDIDASENFNIPTTHARTRVVTPPFSKSTKKRGRQMELASAVAEMSNSFKKYISAVKVERLDVMEVYEEVSNVVDLSKTERLDVCQRLISGNVEEFRLLKGLPDEDKKDWILLLLSRPLT
ncbi:hypothetical protein HHK36_001831 [Tetracentron sinense]|uniref:DUF8040 domain-containing protein n=1 Tax=Tetracentron sinense TaxID=13715 RepID=A0A835DVE1_TETSI|nr:hypothetical protein HHK36_001831 [Tetracentron sinense]